MPLAIIGPSTTKCLIGEKRRLGAAGSCSKGTAGPTGAAGCSALAKGGIDNSDGLKKSLILFLVGLSEVGGSGSGEAGSGAVCGVGADIRRRLAASILSKKASFLIIFASLFSFNFSREIFVIRCAAVRSELA